MQHEDPREPPPRAEDTARGQTRTTLGAAGGQLVAWGLVALSNGILISLFAPMPDARARVRIPHHLFSAGHMLALGFASYWAVCGASRLLPRRLWVRLLAVAALAAVVAALTTGNDLSNFIEKQTAAGSRVPWRPLFAVGIGVAVALVAAIGHLFARPWLRWVAVAGGVAGAVANHYVLAATYPAFHFFVAWCGAVLAGAALATLRIPRIRGARLATPLLAIGTSIAGASLVIPPPNRVWAQLWWSPTDVVMPALARFRASTWRDDGRHPLAGSRWLGDRSSLPDVPPSDPPLYDRPPNVVFVTVDAMRPDLLEKSAHAKKLPSLSALRDRSLYFVNAVSPTPSTVTTLTSMFTGKYYSEIYWAPMEEGPFKGIAMPAYDESTRLPELLTTVGVRSTHVVGLWGLAADVGVGVGFTEEIRARRNYASAKEMVNHAIDALRRNAAEPMFLYMHLLDPHAPYDRGTKSGNAFNDYLSEVQLVDKEIGRLVEFLESESLADHTILVVSADHGEAFSEHRLSYHATSVYDEMIRIPLLICAPGVPPRKIVEPVTLMDMGPTLLDLYGAPTPATFLGESLVPYLRGETPEFTRPIAVDAGRRMQALYFPDGMKALTDLQKGTFELYNRKRDPGEKKNVVDSMGSKGEAYVTALRAFFKNHTLKRPGYVPPWRQF